MSTLTVDEARVLGVLVEKAQTTPAQYPLSVNAIVNGCNQKSNRLPVMSIQEERVLSALDGLRAKGLVREVMLSGSRVQKFRHVTRDTWEVSTSELVVLAELLLRGPQTVGELRGRASRMHPLESMDAVSGVLEHLARREQPFVTQLAPAPGSRAPRFAQLLCPDTNERALAAETGASSSPPEAFLTDEGLETRLGRLESEVAQLREAVKSILGHSAEGGPPPADLHS